MTWTHTSRGYALDLLDPDPGAVDLDEICTALGHICRYAGCTRYFYSVAEHSVLMSDWLRDTGHGVDLQMAALLHDAHEAYTGDITWPMQQVLWGAAPEARKAYEECRAKLEAIICAKVGVAPDLLHHFLVRDADLRILLDERRALLSEPPPRPWPLEQDIGLRPLGVAVRCWPAWRASEEWQKRFEAIYPAFRASQEARHPLGGAA